MSFSIGSPSSSASAKPNRRCTCGLARTMRPVRSTTIIASGAVSKSSRNILRPLHARGEHVAGAAHRLDQLGPGRVVFDLAAQPADLHVDRAIVGTRFAA